MKLTLIEAITKGKDMWQWLADNPGHSKSDYFLFKGCPSASLERPYFNCYTCEIAGVSIETSSGRKCEECFLLPLWFGGKGKIPKDLKSYLIFNTPCERSEKSPYRKWRKTLKPDNAFKIAKYHDKLLKEMGEVTK